jgi:hypothetical protein
MDPLEKQLLDMSGIKEEDATKPAPAPSAVNDTDYSSQNRSHLAPIRTYNTDLADAVREHGGSVVRVAIAEDEKRRREYEETAIGSKRNLFFIIGGTILVLGAIGGVWWAYQNKGAASVVVPVVEAVPHSLVLSDAAQTIDIGPMQVGDIYAAVNGIVAVPGIQPGQVKNIILTKTADGSLARPSASNLLSGLGTHAPDTLLRSLSPDYMLGVYQYDKASLFLIVHGTAHDFLLSGMLAWEPYLFTDLAPLFKIDTSGFTKASLGKVVFYDAIIANHDARAALDADKNPLLYYSFLDPNTILIAADPKVLTEVVTR